MNNNNILKKRWNEVDKKLSTFISKNKKITNAFKHNLSDILDGIKIDYNKLFDYAEKSKIDRLNDEIKDVKNKYKLSNYETIMLNQYTKSKLKNSEYIRGMILVAYIKLYQEQKKIEYEYFDEVVNLVYYDSQKEVINLMPKEEKERVRLLTIPEAFLLQLIGMNSFKGVNWNDYRQATIITNADKMFYTINGILQRGKEPKITDDEISTLIDKQIRNYINKKKVDKVDGSSDEDRYIDQFSGSLDNMTSVIVSQTLVKAFMVQGCTKCQFIAVLDEKTTPMCETLDGQIFNLVGKNTFSRYSAIDNKNVIYEVKGMVLGANLPPIDNHFHYCRSTIYPVR